jgi:transposase
MALYCGIDLHSTNSWIVVLEGGHKVVLEHKARNDLKEILEVLEPYREELVGVAVESTFNWYWLVDGLMDAGYRVHLTNTCRAKQYSGLKYADDRHDARWLAHLLALGILPEGHICPRQERSVRDLLRRRNTLVQKRSSLLISMRGTVERLTSERIGVNDLKRWTGEGLDELVRDPVAAIGLKAFIESIRAMSGQIKILEKEVLARARKRDEYPFLRSVWGIGHILSMTVLYEAGDIRRFGGPGHFASYCRCVKSEKLSNGKRKGSGNAKNGNPYLSWAFSQAGHYAVRHYQPARTFYQRKRSRTNGIVAIRALAHKLARASYYVMRDRVVFDPERVFG